VLASTAREFFAEKSVSVFSREDAVGKSFSEETSGRSTTEGSSSSADASAVAMLSSSKEGRRFTLAEVSTGIETGTEEGSD